MWKGFGVTMILLIGGTAYQLFFTVITGYAMSRDKWFGKNFVMNMILVTMFFGGGLVPYYYLITSLGLYNNILVMEIVFEQTWGDGACLVSEVKTIKKANYSNLFIKKLNFKDYDTAAWKWENDYNFGTDISEDGTSYTLHYDQAANSLNTMGMVLAARLRPIGLRSYWTA